MSVCLAIPSAQYAPGTLTKNVRSDIISSNYEIDRTGLRLLCRSDRCQPSHPKTVPKMQVVIPSAQFAAGTLTKNVRSDINSSNHEMVRAGLRLLCRSDRCQPSHPKTVPKMQVAIPSAQFAAGTLTKNVRSDI